MPEARLSFTVLVPLCPKCDTESPAAQSLLAFFAIHGCVSDDTLELFGALLGRWVAELDFPTIDPAVYDAEIDEWKNGDFD